ncbi:hypothetical protein SADUNF_SadunfUnG0010000 [Salix dunnii]|uniref:Uncharacterized protein n=1 Tax=Salix dunnii TaxID=1413687 RepID=A0A835IZ68_9ROSI|nr:hypothetical protein SADUNF_SadunfUnG0010000 [Salix dunnii]
MTHEIQAQQTGMQGFSLYRNTLRVDIPAELNRNDDTFKIQAQQTGLQAFFLKVCMAITAELSDLSCSGTRAGSQVSDAEDHTLPKPQ